jgi:hypothetical protein
MADVGELKVDLVLDSTKFEAGMKKAVMSSEDAAAAILNIVGNTPQKDIENTTKKMEKLAETTKKASKVVTSKLSPQEYVKYFGGTLEQAAAKLGVVEKKTIESSKKIANALQVEEDKRAKRSAKVAIDNARKKQQAITKVVETEQKKIEPAKTEVKAAPQQPNAPPTDDISAILEAEKAKINEADIIKEQQRRLEEIRRKNTEARANETEKQTASTAEATAVIDETTKAQQKLLAEQQAILEQAKLRHSA